MGQKSFPFCNGQKIFKFKAVVRLREKKIKIEIKRNLKEEKKLFALISQ